MFCTQCGVKADSSSNFCANCGEALSQINTSDASDLPDSGPINAELSLSRRQMTVLFCDLVDSTRMAETMDAEDLFYAMKTYHSMVKRIALRYSGHVAKIVGDGVDLYFGYPLAGEDDAVRAVHVALVIIEEIKQLTDSDGNPLNMQVRIGLATGRVAVGMLDTMSISGSTPHLAARIQAVAQPGQVVVAPITRSVAGTQFAYQDLGMFTLKGFSDPVRISAVTGAYAYESRSAWRGHDSKLPMVGRDAEMASLQKAWKNTHNDQATGIMLLADAGMGKSRLSTAFSESLQDEIHLTIRLQCSPFHNNSVLYPFIQHLTVAADFSRNDSALVQAEKLETQMAIAGITQDQDLALIAALLDIKVEKRYPPLEMPPPAKQEMTQGVLLRYFMGLTRHLPASPDDQATDKNSMAGGNMLLLLEDLHWIDPSSLELLDRLLEHSHGSPTMILMTSRPGFQHKFRSDASVIQIELARLDQNDSWKMVLNLYNAIALPDTAVEQILKKTDGIPLYIEEMTYMVRDLQVEPSNETLNKPGTTGLGVPGTLLDLLMERLDHLGPAKKVAQVAAVLGQEFLQELLAAVAQMDERVFTSALQKVLDSDLILRLGSNHLKFKHALVENTAYDSILLKARAALHARVVECLQGDFASLVQGAPEIMAHHLARANRTLEASRYLLQAGMQTLQRGAPREAAEHLKTGLALLDNEADSPAKDEVELLLLSVLGPTTMVLMGPGSPKFGDVQKRAYALCQKLPGKPRQFPITYGLCLYHWGRAEFEIASPLAVKLLETANLIEREHSHVSDIASDEAVMAACNINGMIAFHMGESEQAHAYLTRSVALYQPDRDAALYPTYLMDFGVFGRFYLSLACVACNKADQARQHARDAYELAQKLDQPHSVGFSLLANMIVAAQCDEAEIAQQYSDQCVAFSSKFGFPEFIGMARVVRGWAVAKLGHPSEGLADLEAGYALWAQTGFENWQSWFTCLKVDILRLLTRNEQADAEIDAQLARIGINKELQFRDQLMARKTAGN